MEIFEALQNGTKKLNPNFFRLSIKELKVPEVFSKRNYSKNFNKINRKTLARKFSFSEIAVLRPTISLKEGLHTVTFT